MPSDGGIGFTLLYTAVGLLLIIATFIFLNYNNDSTTTLALFAAAIDWCGIIGYLYPNIITEQQ